jgi:tRNA G18 (ribose-2'-O)-methylase SpoU
MAFVSQRPPRHVVVESVHHRVLKVYRRGLATGITAEGWLAIEGPILFGDAVELAGGSDTAVADRENRLKIHSVLVTALEADRFAEAFRSLPDDTEIIVIPDRLFKSVTRIETPRGIAALVELPKHGFDATLSRPEALAIVACGLQDPGNIGTTIRSAQALGAAALITLQNTVSPFNPKALRSSAGAALRLPIFTGLDPESLIGRLRGLGMRIVATDRRSDRSLIEEDLRGRVAFLIGQEAAGLEESLRRAADARVGIRIRRDTDSLNAAAAATICLYEAARQRGFRFHEPF